ncbi:ABC transporter ATP-binding protein [Lysobacter humi (ex Lee et al. 2017)]
MLDVQDVRKAYGPTVALDGLSLAVREGEIFGLLGPNGAGKSTLMSLVAGLLRPDAGQVQVGGAAPAEPATRRHIGLAPQALALYDTLTGRENLEFFGRLHDLGGARLRARVDAALGFVALADRQHDRAGGYSGGMKRRLNLAAALLHEPAMVLLDEPTAGVDPQSRNALFDNVEALRAQGRTVVYTTHYMEEVERLCDRIAIVDRGRVLAVGTLAELLAAHGGAPQLVVRRGDREWREAVDDPLARLNAIAQDGPVDDFRVERPRLEQVFLHLTGRQLRD